MRTPASGRPRALEPAAPPTSRDGIIGLALPLVGQFMWTTPAFAPDQPGTGVGAP